MIEVLFGIVALYAGYLDWKTNLIPDWLSALGWGLFAMLPNHIIGIVAFAVAIFAKWFIAKLHIRGTIGWADFLWLPLFAAFMEYISPMWVIALLGSVVLMNFAGKKDEPKPMIYFWTLGYITLFIANIL